MDSIKWLEWTVAVGWMSFAAGVLVAAWCQRPRFERSRPGGRVKRILVNADCLPGLFSNYRLARMHFDGMPEDARFVGARYLAEEDRFEFLVESETFPELLAGERVPEFEVTITEVRLDLLTAFKEN